MDKSLAQLEISERFVSNVTCITQEVRVNSHRQSSIYAVTANPNKEI